MAEDCVFCDRKNFEVRIITKKNGWYIIASLGQIIGGYVLMIPEKHILCLGALSRDHVRTMTILKREVCNALSLQYNGSVFVAPHPVTMFEHGIVGQSIKHTHLHILPMVIDLSPRIRADFPESEIEELLDAAHLQELYVERKEPYLFWTIPSGKSMVCWNPPAPSQYMRLVASQIIGFPERGNWRDMDPKLDERLWKATVISLKPYFP